MSVDKSAAQPFEAAHYKICKKIDLLPKAMLLALADLPMADAGQPYTAGCVVDAAKPAPFARLIFAAVGKTDCLIHYEQGGIAHFFIIAFYRFDHPGRSEQAELVWRVHSDEKLESVQDINQLISSGRIETD